MAYQQQPDAFIWLVRTDGVMVTMAIDRAQEVIAWSRQITAGGFESVASIPSDSNDVVYALVRREIGGQVVRYVEVFDSTLYTDAAVTGSSDAGATTWAGLNHLEGQTVDVVADGSVMPVQVVSSGQITLSRKAYRVEIGLHFESTIQTLTPEVGTTEGTTQSAKKRTSEVTMRFLETTGAECNGQVIPFRTFGPKILNQPAPLFTGDHYFGKWAGRRARTRYLFSSASRCHSTFCPSSPLSPATGLTMIRNATAGDIPALIELGARMYLESRYAETSPFDEQKCAELAQHLIAAPGGCVLVAERDSQVIGWLAGGIAEQWFSRKLMAFEYGLFIAPEHRGGSAGPRLAKTFIAWAADNGAAVINMGITTGVHEERTGAMYERLGLSRTGLLYSKEI